MSALVKNMQSTTNQRYGRQSCNFAIPVNMASTRENLSSGFANNKAADQPAHAGSLISAFVVHLLESIIS